MLVSMNKLVACSPFPRQNMEKVVKGGFAMIDKKVQLQELEVRFFCSDPELHPGMKIWVRGDAIVQPWAKEVFVEEGTEFILVPASVIQLASGGKWQSGC